ncbi:MAG: hypothetical protein AAFR13_00860 [Pseudomonadota bacterium]
MIEFLVYPVTGFAVALCIFFLHAAIQGWYVDFVPYAVDRYGSALSAIWFAGTGPVVTAKMTHMAFATERRFQAPVKGICAFALSIFWATMLGVVVLELSHMAMS